MKEVILAKSAGFCFGVKRAVDTVYEQTGKKNVYTFGPIIHNEEVVKDLEKKGVFVINTMEELDDITEGTVIIRSHGVSSAVYEALQKKGVEIVDATSAFERKKYHDRRCHLSVCIKNSQYCETGKCKWQADCYYRQ